MLFNSFEFLVFFPIVVLIFAVVPKALRSCWLLIASYYFYMSWKPQYAILIAFSTVVTYISGILLEKRSKTSSKKLIVAGSFICNLAILGIFKYANFTLDSLSSLFGLFGLSFTDRRLDLLLPVGISFYTFQALGYTIDVYRGDIKAEKNFISYALFVSFFPQLVAGPIERSGNLLKQMQRIKEIRIFDYERMKNGLILMFWGLFQKLVIADRASICVNGIYNNYDGYSAFELSLATALFAFQIYCDFAGYTNIARGAAKVMGFTLMDNFRQPYLSTSIGEYWRRWHISMTTWFRDYLYFPLGGSRKGIIRKYINILIVFFVSGLWHGASWHFVAWGTVNAILQIIEDIRSRILKRFVKKDISVTLPVRIPGICINFVFICFTLVFFASDSVRMAANILIRIFTRPVTFMVDGFGIGTADWIILAAALFLLICADVIHEAGISVIGFLDRQWIGIRFAAYAGLIWSLILFGIYGTGYDTGQFIYFQF